MFDNIKQVWKMQQEAQRIKKELSNIHIEAEEEGVVVTVNGEMEMISVKIPPEMMVPEKAERLGSVVTKATNKAIKKAQQIAAEKMKGMMGDMQGLLGGGAPQA